MQFTRLPSFPRARPPGWQMGQPARDGSAALVILTLVAMVGLTACATERGDRKRLLERVPPPQPVLTASAAYGSGALEVHAWLGPTVRLRKAEGGPDSAGGRAHAGRHEERRPNFSSTLPDYPERADTPFESGANSYSSAEIEEMYGRVNYQYILPPRLALTLTVANKSAQTVTLAVADVNSLLGNFAPRPEKFVLASGQQGSIDPMLSTFDNNFEELDVTLTIRRGDQRETQVLKLRRAQPPSPSTPGKPRQD